MVGGGFNIREERQVKVVEGKGPCCAAEEA